MAESIAPGKDCAEGAVWSEDGEVETGDGEFIVTAGERVLTRLREGRNCNFMDFSSS